MFLQAGIEYSPDRNTFQCILKGPRKHLIVTYFSLTFISEAHLTLKKCLPEFQGQILRLRSSKSQKGQKNLNVRNSFLNTNQKEFLGYLPYLLSYTHSSGGILICDKL